jgi:hypothetical protein
VVRGQALRPRYRICRGRGKKLQGVFRQRLSRRDAETDDWLAELAAAYPDEAWLQPTDADDELTDEPWHGLYWEAWEALRFDRQFGAMGGQTPISYAAISQYARDNGLVGEDFRRFRQLLAAIDDVWLQHLDEQAKAKGGVK